MKWTDQGDTARDPIPVRVPWWVARLAIYVLGGVGVSLGVYAIDARLDCLPGPTLTTLAITLAVILYARLVICRRARAARKGTP